MATDWKIVIHHGIVWRLTKTRFIELLTAITLERDFDIEKLGIRIGSIVANTTDMDKKGAADLLWELKPMGLDPIPDWIMLK
jgi:hypothetical protein